MAKNKENAAIWNPDTLEKMGDVAIVSPQEGQVLSRKDGKWSNEDLPEVDLSNVASKSDLDQVEMTVEEISLQISALEEDIEQVETTPGPKGDDGLSAYELAVQQGYVGTLQEWIDSLKGEQGDPATNLVQSVNGKVGSVVISASDVGAPTLSQLEDVDNKVDSALDLSSQAYSLAEDVDTALGVHLQDPDAHGLEDIKDDLSSVQTQTVSNSESITEILEDLQEKAPLNSPQFTGIPTAPTAEVDSNGTQVATTSFVQAVAEVLYQKITGMAPENLNSFLELSSALGNDPNFATTVMTSLAGKLSKSANLSDVANPNAARANIDAAAAVHNHSINEVSGLQTALNTANTSIATHANRTDNPHSVTKSQVGLSNVDDTSDAAKPISTATAAALAGKQPTGDYARRNEENTFIDRQQFLENIRLGPLPIQDPTQGNGLFIEAVEAGSNLASERGAEYSLQVESPDGQSRIVSNGIAVYEGQVARIHLADSLVVSLNHIFRLYRNFDYETGASWVLLGEWSDENLILFFDDDFSNQASADSPPGENIAPVRYYNKEESSLTLEGVNVQASSFSGSYYGSGFGLVNIPQSGVSGLTAALNGKAPVSTTVTTTGSGTQTVSRPTTFSGSVVSSGGLEARGGFAVTNTNGGNFGNADFVLRNFSGNSYWSVAADGNSGSPRLAFYDAAQNRFPFSVYAGCPNDSLVVKPTGVETSGDIRVGGYATVGGAMFLVSNTSTTAAVPTGWVTSYWAESTHAIRRSRTVFVVADYNATREAIAIDATGSGVTSTFRGRLVVRPLEADPRPTSATVFQVQDINGNKLAGVRDDGLVYGPFFTTTDDATASLSQNAYGGGTNGILLASGSGIAFSSDGYWYGAKDVGLVRDGANTVRVTNGGAGRGNLSLNKVDAIGDVEITDPYKGVIQKDRGNGKRYRLYMMNGNFGTEEVT